MYHCSPPICLLHVLRLHAVLNTTSTSAFVILYYRSSVNTTFVAALLSTTCTFVSSANMSSTHSSYLLLLLACLLLQFPTSTTMLNLYPIRSSYSIAFSTFRTHEPTPTSSPISANNPFPMILLRLLLSSSSFAMLRSSLWWCILFFLCFCHCHPCQQVHCITRILCVYSSFPSSSDCNVSQK